MAILMALDPFGDFGKVLDESIRQANNRHAPLTILAIAETFQDIQHDYAGLSGASEELFTQVRRKLDAAKLEAIKQGVTPTVLIDWPFTGAKHPGLRRAAGSGPHHHGPSGKEGLGPLSAGQRCGKGHCSCAVFRAGCSLNAGGRGCSTCSIPAPLPAGLCREPYCNHGVAMEPMSMETILNSFTKRQRRHVVVPDISRVDWAQCEYLSWMHTSGHMAYVVYNHQKPAIGLVLRRTKLTGAQRQKMCSWCLTMHQVCGVNMFTAHVGDDQNRVCGDYLCNDLRCSAYVRGFLRSGACQMRETITEDERIARLRRNIEQFISTVYGRDA